jgi:hypothetical protein
MKTTDQLREGFQKLWQEKLLPRAKSLGMKLESTERLVEDIAWQAYRAAKEEKP